MSKLDSKQRKHVLDKLESIKNAKIREFAPHRWNRDNDPAAIKKVRAKIAELEKQIEAHEESIEASHEKIRAQINADFEKLEDQVILGDDGVAIINLLENFSTKTYA